MHFIRFVVLLPLLWLTACEPTQEAAQAPVIQKEEKEYAASDYLLNLGMAKLSLDGPAQDITQAVPHLKTMNAYSIQRSKKPVKMVPQQIVVLEFRFDGQDSTMLMVAPVNASSGFDFVALQQMIDALGSAPYILYDVRVLTASVPKLRTIPENIKDGRHMSSLLARKQAVILKYAKKLSPLEETKMQLRLTRFFMKKQLRDGAYLSIENAKDALARAAADPAEKENPEILRLTEEHQAMESHLHKTMPYPL